MAFNPPKFIEIRDTILRDIVSLNKKADVAIDSDNYVRASSLASCAEGQYAHQSWIVRQIFPDSADTEFLELHAATRAIYRKNATIGRGVVRIFGSLGSVIKAGTEIKLNDRYYTVDIDSVISADDRPIADSADIDITAKSAGTAYNIGLETDALLTAAPSGCQSECTVLEVLGGTDIETDSSLLARLLERIRRPPAGGNRHDYRNWALSVDGVTNAYVYPLRRGLGTVDIAITSGNGLPSDEIIERTQKYIDEVRPVTAKQSLVIAPNAINIDFVIKVALQEITLTAVTEAINLVLNEYFLRLAPASPVIVSQIEALISDIVGVIDRDLVSPHENIVGDLVNSIDWFRLGMVEVSEL